MKFEEFKKHCLAIIGICIKKNISFSVCLLESDFDLISVNDNVIYLQWIQRDQDEYNLDEIYEYVENK